MMVAVDVPQSHKPMDERLAPFGVQDAISNELGDPAWLLAGTDIAGARRPFPAFVSVRDYFRVARNVRDQAGVPGFHLGQMPNGRLPIRRGLGLALYAAPSAAEGFAVFVRQMNALIPFARFDMCRSDSNISIVMTSLVDSDVMPLMVESAVHGLHSYATRYRPGIEQAVTIGVRHLPIMSTADYRRFFSCRLAFADDQNVICFPRHEADEISPLFDEALWALALGQCEAQIAALTDATEVQRVRKMARAHTQPGLRPPAADETAALLGQSVRTLGRHMEAAGTSYRALTDEIQKERLETLIQNHQVPIADIADALGFADQSSFGRTFRRWFGTSPQAYRAWLGISRH